jgi:pimeloyl-ACP methyl ester carboxylesterase
MATFEQIRDRHPALAEEPAVDWVEPDREQPSRDPRRPLDVVSWGTAAGARVLLVHGSLLDGPATWAHQQPMSARWRMLVVQRRGFGSSPAGAGEDFERDADDLCELLGEPAHVVGHAYGAIGALIAATRRPRSVRSLTLIEPTCIRAEMQEPEIAAAAGAIADWWMEAPTDKAEFLAAYGALIGVRVPALDGGRRALREAARFLRSCRPPWTAELPFEEVGHARIPTLVVSGGHSPALDAVAASIARSTGGRHKVIAGAGHAVQRAAGAFNPALEAHLLAAQAVSS